MLLIHLTPKQQSPPTPISTPLHHPVACARNYTLPELNIKMVDEGTKKTLASIPLLRTNAGPLDGERWPSRLKEEYLSLIKVSVQVCTWGNNYTWFLQNLTSPSLTETNSITSGERGGGGGGQNYPPPPPPPPPLDSPCLLSAYFEQLDGRIRTELFISSLCSFSCACLMQAHTTPLMVKQTRLLN